MSVFKLSRKNVFETWWRSFALGTFIFLATFLLLFFNSFIHTMKENFYDAINNSITGDLQVRAGITTETDMLSLKGRWGEMAYLKSGDVAKIEQVLSVQTQPVEFTQRVRNNAILAMGTNKQHAMIVGLDPKSEAYTKAFKLTEGKYLNPAKKNEILIPSSYASKLGVKIGDIIEIEATTKDGKLVTVKRMVVGIGDVERLSNFSFFPCYTSVESAAELTGLAPGEATDFILYTADRNKADQAATDLSAALAKAGLGADAVKVTTWKEMGGFLTSIISIYVGMLYAFIGILLVIMSILIVNLIFMMGLERRQEIGTLRAIGFSRGRIVSIFMGEVLIITAIFFAIGMALGTALILILSKVGIPMMAPLDVVLGKEFLMRFDATQILPVTLVIFGFALLASLYPSYKAASIKPAETLREV